MLYKLVFKLFASIFEKCITKYEINLKTINNVYLNGECNERK